MKEITLLGPLEPLLGVWEGQKGDDIAPSDDRKTFENNKYREWMTFETIKPLSNHEQALYGLRYSTMAWRLNEVDPFHEDIGYWMWDAKAEHVMKCFSIPRGITILAGGPVKSDSKTFVLQAKDGSSNYGICQNLFLEKEFRIVSFDLTLEIVDANTLRYDQNTRIKLKNREDIFDHRDKNTLKRIQP
jgi:hypothetical protein